jgi:hypothetical protein
VVVGAPHAVAIETGAEGCFRNNDIAQQKLRHILVMVKGVTGSKSEAVRKRHGYFLLGWLITNTKDVEGSS